MLAFQILAKSLQKNVANYLLLLLPYIACVDKKIDGIHELYVVVVVVVHVQCTYDYEKYSKVSTVGACSVLISCMDWKFDPQNTLVTVLFLTFNLNSKIYINSL